MGIDLVTGKQILADTIQKNLRHEDYKRVCEIAKEYSAYVTGECIADFLKRYNPRESEEQFNQRKLLTELITPYIAARVMSPMYKVGRTMPTSSISWQKSEGIEDKRKKIDDSIKLFAGEESLDDYLTRAMVEKDSTDPNSFIVIEIEGKVDPADPKSVADPYPFEVCSEEAIYYKRKNNILQFLVVLQIKAGMKRYTIYLENDSVVAQQITKDEFNALKLDKTTEIIFQDPVKKEDGEIFLVTSITHNLKKIPAICIGTKRDLATNNRTFVPLIHPARSFFRKSIKTISEYDLTMANHVFPKMIQYDMVCPGDLANNAICNGGKTPSGEICGICKGSGFNEHLSSADVLRVKLPADPKDLFDLDKLIAYKTPPIELIKFMKDVGLYEYPDLATKAVYTSELYTADSVASTATEKLLDYESIYDALKAFADKWASVRKQITLINATYLNVSDGINVEFKFPKDFKMKPLTQLLADLKAARDSGAESYIIAAIQADIAEKIFIDKQDELAKISIKKKFFPFNGKSESEISTIITNGLVSKFNQVLYANFDLIFDELEQENTTESVSFWKMEFTMQKELLQNKVEEFITEIEDESAASAASSFGSAGNDTGAGPGETQDYQPGDPVTFSGQPVEIMTANPGPDGGAYRVKLPDGTEQDVKGTDLQKNG